MQVLLGDTHRREIKCRALCGSWAGRCSHLARWVCPTAVLHPQHPAQAGAEVSVCWRLPCVLASLLAFVFRQARPAAKPRAPSRGCAVPPHHPTCSPATSTTHIIRSQPGPALPQGCSQGSGCHSWTEPDSYTQLEEAQLRMRMEEVCCEQHRPSVHSGERGETQLRGQWGTPTHMPTLAQRPTLLPREEIINLLGKKSAASQKTILPRRRRKATRPPPRALPASSPVAFVPRDSPDARASVWAPRPRAGMKRGPGFAPLPRALAPRGTRPALGPRPWPPPAALGQSLR